MYTKHRNSAGTHEKVTNLANWRIKRWRLRQVLLYIHFRVAALENIVWLSWEQWLKWQLRPSLPVPVFLTKYSVLGRDAEINWTELSIWLLSVRKLLLHSYNNHIFYEPNKHNQFCGHRAYLYRFELVICPSNTTYSVLILNLCQRPIRGVTKGGKGSATHRAPNHYGGAKSLWGRRMTAGGAESPNNVTSTFFNTVHFLPKDLRFEPGGAKLASCPGRHLTSLRPWGRWMVNSMKTSFAQQQSIVANPQLTTWSKPNVDTLFQVKLRRNCSSWFN